MFASVKWRMLIVFVVSTLVIPAGASADWTKTQSGLGLGTSAIRNPIHPESSDDAWMGSYVYYGRYHTDEARKTPLVPVRYRVLDKASSAFGVEGGSLFLDCDKILYKAPFDRSANRTNVWEECTEREFLNGGKDAYDGKVFFGREGVFSDAEEAAIAISKMDKSSDAREINGFVPTGLNGDRIFLLDITDVENPAYGYGSDNARKKTFVFPIAKDWHSWWLRSPGSNGCQVGRIRTEGTYFIENNMNKQDYVGASPAFNVKLPSIIFSSLVNGKAEEPGAEYKLTLRDTSMDITLNTTTRNGDTFTVYYTLTGEHAANATQVSVLVTDGTWDKDNGGWRDGSTVIQYGVLSGNFGTSGGWGTFTLDSDSVSGTRGREYHVYILAEDVNGQNETDYASAPINVTTAFAGNIEESGSDSQENNGVENENSGQENDGVETGSSVVTISGSASSLEEALANKKTAGLEKVTELKIEDAANLTNLEGIQNLENLEMLEISNATKLASLSGLEELENLKSLDVSGCPALETANLCGLTNLTELSVSDCAGLMNLDCSDAGLEELVVENCLVLVSLDCHDNSLGHLDIHHDSLPNLAVLICYGQKRDDLNVERSGGVWKVDLSDYTEAKVSISAVRLAGASGVVAGSVKGYSEGGLSLAGTCAAGVVGFTSRPASVAYDYATGFEDVLMDVTITGSGSGGSNGLTSSTGGGCDAGFGGWALLALSGLATHRRK